MATYFLRVGHPGISTAIQKLAYSMGWRLLDSDKEVESPQMANLRFDDVKRHYWWNNDIRPYVDDTELDLPKLVELLKKDGNTKLGDIGEYPVIMQPDGTLKVGCQTVSADLIEKIWKAYQERKAAK